MKLTLTAKLTGLILVAGIILFSVMAFLEATETKKILIDSYIDKAHSISLAIGANVKSKEDLEYDLLMRSIQKHIWLNSDIVEIQLNSFANGSLTTIASNKYENIGKASCEDNLYVYTNTSPLNKIVDEGNSRLLRVITPLYLSGRPVGTYQIDFTLSEVDRLIFQKIIDKIKIYSLFLVIFSGIFFFFINLLVIRPINTIDSGLHQIAKNNLDYEIRISSKDELGNVASTFNLMRNEIKSSRKEIEEYSRTLEKKVQERTQELNEKIDELRVSEKKFHDIASSSADWIWEIDSEARYTYASGKVQQILGYSPGEMIGKAPFDFMPADEAERVKAIMKGILSEKAQIIDLENLNITKTGEKVYLLTNGVPAFNGSGEFIGYRGVDKDITERKNAERTLMEKNQMLLKKEKEIIEFNKTLEEANAKLKELDKQKDEFISIAAHELKTPLTSIKGFAQLMQNEKIMQDKATMGHYLSLVNQNTVRLYSLILDLVDSSRLSLGKLQLDINNIDVAAVFKDVKDNMENMIKEKGIKPAFNLGENVPLIRADYERLLQIIRNLVVNAIHFTNQGGEISFSAYKKEGNEENGRFVQFEIKDTGEGIPEDKQKDIFSRFYQADASLTRKVKGSGLGLSICKGLVEKMSGKIWFESKEGKGTTFYFTLPVAKKAD